MKARIHGHPARCIQHQGLACRFLQQSTPFLDTGLQDLAVCHAELALGHQTRRHALQHAPHIDGIGEFVGVEGLDAKAPGRQAFEQAFLGQFFKRQPDRRARNPQVCRHGQLDQPLARRVHGRGNAAAKFVGNVVDLGDHGGSVPSCFCMQNLFLLDFFPNLS